MNAMRVLILGAALIAISLEGRVIADNAQGRFVRIAELEIDPDQIERFKSAIRQGIETAIRVEPGVLVLYAVAEKDNPTRIRVFEVYTSAEAYRTRLETPHFRKFRDTTDKMVRSRKLLDAVPIALGAKEK
jgi:quinol monooxygenase YgiN